MRKRVLVIGSGRRATRAILPALRCLSDDYELAAVYSRSAKTLSLLQGEVEVRAIASLERAAFADVELVMVAVATNAVPAVLDVLCRHDTRHLILMLDTPVLRIRDLRAWRFFTRFRRVVVSEDTIALPPFVLARRLVDEGRIGGVKHVYFFHNGFRYHGVAGLRMLAGRSPVRRMLCRRYADGRAVKEAWFENGVHALMVEPVDYAKGKFLVEGESGFVSDYDRAGENALRIAYLVEDRVYRGLTLNGEPVAGDPLDASYGARIHADPHDTTPMSTMKVRGLMDLVVAADRDASPFHYRPVDGMLDRFVVRAADALGVYDRRIFPW